jgi:cell shape-determining protein MreC
MIKHGNTILNAVMSGQNDELPALLHLPEDVVLSEDAHIMTSGLGHIYPKGLPVGRVVLHGDDYLVQPYLQTSHLSYVRVLMPDEKNILQK